jgi:hypothetical protein
MNTVHIIILVLSVVIAILAIVMMTKKSKGEMFAIGDAKASFCQKYIEQQCKAQQDAFLDTTHPYESGDTWNELQACVNKADAECACKFKDQIVAKCYDSYKNSEEWNSRVLGCYNEALTPEQQTACFANPNAFLCKDPKSEACQDFQSLCALDGCK